MVNVYHADACLDEKLDQSNYYYSYYSRRWVLQYARCWTRLRATSRRHRELEGSSYQA